MVRARRRARGAASGRRRRAASSSSSSRPTCRSPARSRRSTARRTIIGAQDAAAEDTGAFTGEVSPAELAEIGVRVVEIGHAERRRLFGDTDEVVRAKTHAALRNGLRPVLCIGETSGDEPSAAAGARRSPSSRDALDGAPAGPLIVAYEPVWAIGAPEPAPVDHIRTVDAGAARRGARDRPGNVGDLRRIRRTRAAHRARRRGRRSVPRPFRARPRVAGGRARRGRRAGDRARRGPATRDRPRHVRVLLAALRPDA